MTDPVYDPFISTLFASGATIAHSDFIGPGAEAEIAFRMATNLAGPGITPQAAAQAVESLLPAIELRDMTFVGKSHFTDLIADCAVSAAIAPRHQHRFRTHGSSNHHLRL
ncbi:MAG: hypothetical protein EXR09_11960, partial [Acetobacteraceae bacterium]|nr:hypothetical protein [Acetobacteraceae bacterium]